MKQRFSGIGLVGLARITCGVGLALLAGCDGQVVTASGGNGATGGGSTTSAVGGNQAGGGGQSASTASTTDTATQTGTDCGFCDFVCCGATCVNLDNDILNCGECGNKCEGAQPYCDKGKCAAPPCDGPLCGATEYCCGTACCGLDDLCCTVPGPVGDTTSCLPPNELGTCPTGCATCQCLSPDANVATPQGDVAAGSLRVGDLVYSVHEGRIAAVPIAQTTTHDAPRHVVLRVALANGETLEVSPAHPTADGRTFADLAPGTSLGGIDVVSVTPVPFRYPYTVDLLPASDTGTYFIGGALVGSTLAPHNTASSGVVSTSESAGPLAR